MVVSKSHRFIYLWILLLNTRKFVHSSQGDMENNLYISLLKIVTEDGSANRINDTSKYVMENYGSTYYFSFGGNSKCTEIRYDNSLVWSNNSSQEYPRALCIHLDLREIYLQVKDSAYIYENNNNVWTLKSQKKLEDFAEDSIEIKTQDGSNNYKVEKCGISLSYFFEPGSKCNEVKFNGHTLWSLAQFGYKTPKRLYFNLFKRIALVDFRSFYLVFSYRDYGSNLVNKTEIDKDSTSKLTIVTDDRSDLGQKENDHGKFQLNKYDLISQFLFNEEANCVEFRYANQAVWRYDYNTQAGHPKSLCFLTDLRLIFLELPNCVNTYKCNENGCVLITTFPLNGFSSSKLTIVTDGPLGLTNNDPGNITVKSFGFGTEYVLSNDVKCNSIVYDGKTVWNYESRESENKSPLKLFFHLYTRLMIVDFSDFYLVYKFDSNEFKFATKDTLLTVSDKDFSFIGDDGFGSTKLDNSQYDLIKYPYGYACVFQFKEGTKVTEFKFKDKSVWKGKEGTQNPKLLYANWDMKMLFLESPEFVIAYMYLGGEWNPIFKYPEVDLPQGPDEDDSSLRGYSNKNQNNPKPQSFNTDNKTTILIVGSIVVSVILLILVLLVFYYLK